MPSSHRHFIALNPCRSSEVYSILRAFITPSKSNLQIQCVFCFDFTQQGVGCLVQLGSGLPTTMHDPEQKSHNIYKGGSVKQLNSYEWCALIL